LDGVPAPAAEVVPAVPVVPVVPAVPLTCERPTMVVARRGDVRRGDATAPPCVWVTWVTAPPAGPNMGVGAGVRVEPKKGVCCAGAAAGAKKGDGAGVLGENMGEATDMEAEDDEDEDDEECCVRRMASCEAGSVECGPDDDDDDDEEDDDGARNEANCG
jgi:hypothetical protein